MVTLGELQLQYYILQYLLLADLMVYNIIIFYQLFFISSGKICTGLGGAASNVHKDIYKSCRTALTDRVMSVRIGN